MAMSTVAVPRSISCSTECKSTGEIISQMSPSAQGMACRKNHTPHSLRMARSRDGDSSSAKRRSQSARKDWHPSSRRSRSGLLGKSPNAMLSLVTPLKISGRTHANVTPERMFAPVRGDGISPSTPRACPSHGHRYTRLQSVSRTSSSTWPHAAPTSDLHAASITTAPPVGSAVYWCTMVAALSTTSASVNTKSGQHNVLRAWHVASSTVAAQISQPAVVDACATVWGFPR